MPSRFLDEIPASLIAWRQSPQDVMSRPTLRPTGSSGWGGGERRFGEVRTSNVLEGARGLKEPFNPRRGKRSFDNTVTGAVKDNSALELAHGDRVKHTDFGEGTVRAVLGTGSKRVAEVDFDDVGRKKLLIKVAPLEKL
jgi:DNA helicase-2/ATP-dependent DNA helicase PcrA